MRAVDDLVEVVLTVAPYKALIDSFRELSKTDMGNGFANRHLWACTSRSKELPEGGNLRDEDLSPLAEKLRDAAAFAKTFPCDGSDAVYFYTRDVPQGEKPCELQARMFHPGASGLSEDPATGSATAACAALLADLDAIKDGELKLKIGQGVDMSRPSLLLTRVRKKDGAVASIHVGGSCVQIMEGTFRLDGKG